MRIAMIAHTCYEFDTRVKRAAEALTESGHHVDIFAASHKGVSQSSNNALLYIRRLRMGRQRTSTARYAFEYGVFFAWALSLVSLLNVRRRYDVVYVHNMPNFLVFAGLLPKITGARIVLDIHDPTVELLACIRGRELSARLQRIAIGEERISISFADAVITVNESMRQRLSATSRRPVAVVMNLPDPEVFGSRDKYRLGTAGQWLVYSGTVARRNGLDLVVQALSRLTPEFPKLGLRIFGEGPAVESVLQLAREEGVGDRVQYRSFVPHHEIPAVVSDALAGISAQREDAFGSLVFSVKVAEYAALGLPVICSGSATMRHYFGDDEMLFFEPGSTDDLARAIRELLADPAAADERAFRSQIKLDKLSWSAQKETLVEVVEALAGPARSHSPRRPGIRVPARAFRPERSVNSRWSNRRTG